VEEVVPVTLPALRRRDVVKHAWGHIKESWRTAFIGAVITAVLPVLLQWADNYHFSESGWDKVTGGGWVWSLIAVGLWLFLIAVWHFLCAPMSHAREVIAAHRDRHAAEIERARAEAKSEAGPRIGQYVHQQIVVESPEQASKLVKEGSEHAEADAPDEAGKD
jgi:hypothetical protein